MTWSIKCRMPESGDPWVTVFECRTETVADIALSEFMALDPLQNLHWCRVAIAS